MSYGAEVALSSEVNTKNINTVWEECKIVEFWTAGASRNQ